MGGSVTMPAPDPELERGQIEDMRVRMGIAKDQWAMAKQMQPLQKDQLQFGLDASKTAYEQTQADRRYALEKRGAYDAALDGVLAETKKFNQASRTNELGQQAAADVSRIWSIAQEQGQRGRSRAGINPISGKAIMAGQMEELGEASARAEAKRAVREAARQEGLNLNKANADMLGGFGAMASQLSPTSANLGWSGVNVMNEGTQGINAGYGTGAALSAAVGSNAANMYNLQSNLHTQSVVDNANRKGELMGTIAGAGGTLGAAKGGSFLASMNEKYNPNFMGPQRAG